MKINQLILAILLLLGATGVSAQSHHTSAIIHQPSEKQELYKTEIREKLQLDWSMPDYTTSKIDPRVMGPRLAAILTRLNDIYTQPTNLSVLSLIQTNQIEGLSYGKVKKMKLSSVVKKGNEIRIDYVTTMEPNNKNVKTANLSFIFIDGVSEDNTTNDFFSNICRYIKE